MNTLVNKTIHMDLEEVVEVMGITKQKLALIRCKTSRHYKVPSNPTNLED